MVVGHKMQNCINESVTALRRLRTTPLAWQNAQGTPRDKSNKLEGRIGQCDFKDEHYKV